MFHVTNVSQSIYYENFDAFVLFFRKGNEEQQNSLSFEVEYRFMGKCQVEGKSYQSCDVFF
jgi:hypothetical protein